MSPPLGDLSNLGPFFISVRGAARRAEVNSTTSAYPLNGDELMLMVLPARGYSLYGLTARIIRVLTVGDRYANATF